ncbi:unnamed protein product [Penicillium nalgiovense]|uniref:Uncharacterized protein n=1 Tax=Penicillium nalgiovense TaxID=60175 RepID=A0A9W4HAQ0_PENNA|nr:unnamed protein product [Penicillium nalgiovense]CAG7950320.1 unnamed protein product [Penicillium nalgiovense]CAG7951031.1 unnamed protein product [Penicillium nalgiovense]CAG8039440.1 unnamed protein product [Penicillium nalgiovense]CAG8051775.1 unnamed protein product [Penicillium nalgiovense]
MPPVWPFGDSSDVLGSTVAGLYVRDENTVNTLSSIDPNTHHLLPRADSSAEETTKPKHGQGTVDPHSIKMQGLMALFALIGLAFVLGAIWFFFWAKNGGFVWRKGDWDDYKSTVLRRKGPDGKTLSNATASTKLGGGSVVGKGYTDDGYSFTEGSYTDTATTVTEEKSRRKKFRETAKEKLIRRNKREQWEGAENADVRAYREEKPARIGGMNREADGTYHGSDYDTSAPPTSYQSEMSQSYDFAYDQPPPPRRNPSGFSFTQGSEDVISQVTEEPRVRDPSTRRHNRRRERRSEVGPSGPPPAPSSRTSSPRKHRERRSAPQGHFTEPLDFSSAGSRSEYQYSNVDTEDSGTKSYKHPVPGLTKGYRRDGRSRRRDSLSDSEGETQYS